MMPKMQHKRLIFLHNTRCAGNAFIKAIVQNHLDKVVKLGRFKGRMVPYEEICHTANNPNIRFILGHNVYGLHKHIKGPFEYFTNIRDPVERLISGFCAWGNKRETLSQWLDKGTTGHFESCNGMIKRLCGYGVLEEKYYDFLNDEYLAKPPQVDEKYLDQAIMNIESCFGPILVQEMQIESILLFEEKYDLPPLFSLMYNRHNQSARFSAEEMRPDVIKRIKDLSHYDYILYGRLVKQLKQTLDSKPPEFHEKVRIRKILSSMTSVPGKGQLTNQDLIDSLNIGITKLVQFGMKEELTEVLVLIIDNRFMTKEFSHNVIQVVKPHLPPMLNEKLLNAYHNRG